MLIGLHYLIGEKQRRERENSFDAPVSTAETLAVLFNEKKIKNFLNVDWMSLNDELGRLYDDQHMGIHILLYLISSIPLRVRLADFLAENAEKLFFDQACQFIQLECKNVSQLFSKYDTYSLSDNDYSNELSLLQQRHDALHHEFAELQKKESGHASVINAQEKMILELQQEKSESEKKNIELQEKVFYLKKELELALKKDNSREDEKPSSLFENTTQEAQEIAKFEYIQSTDMDDITEIEWELEQLMTGNNAAKVCDTLLEYQDKMNYPHKLPESIYASLEKRWPNLVFSKESFCQAWRRKNKKK